MTLLAHVVRVLRANDVPHCLIGAAALAAHGVSRSTRDVDLLALGPTVLEEATWHEMADAGASVDLRRGDIEDPLAGVVRLSKEGERAIDVVVGRSSWQHALIARAPTVRLSGVEIPVAQAADVVLLKLFAGGPQDLWDIRQLLDTPAGSQVARDAMARLGELPIEARRAWERIQQESR